MHVFSLFFLSVLRERFHSSMARMHVLEEEENTCMSYEEEDTCTLSLCSFSLSRAREVSVCPRGGGSLSVSLPIDH